MDTINSFLFLPNFKSFAFVDGRGLGRLDEVSVLGPDAVVQDTAHTADLDRVVVPLAGGPVLRGRVGPALQGVLSQEADVALLAPVATPAVSDLPELLAGSGVGAVAHEEHGVVQIDIFAVGAKIDHPGVVKLPGIGCDGDHQGAVVDQAHHHGSEIVGLHVAVSGDGDGGRHFGAGGLALAVSAGVMVPLFLS